MDIEDLRELCVNVNASLPYYEKDYISVKRSPASDRERVTSFRQYIECRINYECFGIPQLRPYAEAFDGYLFEVTAVIGQDEDRRRFTIVEAEIRKSPEYYMADGESDFMETLDNAMKVLGGSKLRFNYSQKKTKIYIE